MDLIFVQNFPGEWNASADNARLYMEDDFKNFRIGAWCSKYPPKQGEWLKIDLGRRRKITAVATQGLSCICFLLLFKVGFQFPELTYHLIFWTYLQVDSVTTSTLKRLNYPIVETEGDGNIMSKMAVLR